MIGHAEVPRRRRRSRWARSWWGRIELAVAGVDEVDAEAGSPPGPRTSRTMSLPSQGCLELLAQGRAAFRDPSDQASRVDLVDRREPEAGAPARGRAVQEVLIRGRTRRLPAAIAS